MTEQAWLETAKSLGISAARNAASWVTDDNESDDSRLRKIKAIRDGDPIVDDLLPNRPNLSGGWADDLTTGKLITLVTGWPPERLSGEEQDAICEAWEEAVSEEFESACEAELLKWLPEDPGDE